MLSVDKHPNAKGGDLQLISTFCLDATHKRIFLPCFVSHLNKRGNAHVHTCIVRTKSICFQGLPMAELMHFTACI